MLIIVFHRRREGHQELAIPRTTQLPPPQRGAPQDARALRKPQLLQRRDENSRRGQDQEKSKTLTCYQYINASSFHCLFQGLRLAQGGDLDCEEAQV